MRTCAQLRLEVDPYIRAYELAALLVRQQVEVGEGESATGRLTAVAAHSPSLDLVWENRNVYAFTDNLESRVLYTLIFSRLGLLYKPRRN